MTTYVTVFASTNALNALHCAQNALLSYESVEDSYMKESIFTLYGLVHHKIIQRRFKTTKDFEKFSQLIYMPCLITVKPITNATCELFISVSISDVGFIQDFSGNANEFISEFLRRFSEMLEGASF